jgi:hypothetical protein
MPGSLRRRLSPASGRARIVCCTLALGLACTTSAAQAAPEPIALEYRAASGCPNPEFFTTQVIARTAQVRFDDAGTAGSFRVVVQSTAQGYSGVLSVIDRNGKTSVRSFQAERCENVVVALALVAALAVDPNASTTPGAAPAAAVETDSVPDRAASNQATRSSPPSPAPIVDRRTAPAPGREGAWAWSAGASTQGLSGVTPSLLVAFGAFVGVEKNGEGWAPGFRLSPYYAGTGRTGPDVNRADFHLLGARAGACLFRVRLSSMSRLSPCAGIDAAWLRARGSDGEVPRPIQRDWLWLSASLDAQVDVTVSEPLFFEANAGLVVPLIRHRFRFEIPEEELVHQVPPVAARVGFSLGVRFP